MKKNLPKNNSRLYITEDTDHDNVWYARTEVEQIARLKRGDDWEIYFYPYKFTRHKSTLKEALGHIEHLFKEYWCQ